MQSEIIRLTDEQRRCVELFASGKNTTVEAGAGTGKTSTLKAMGESDRRKRSQYVAFNRAIVIDAGSKMPRNVRARTAHSIAKKSVGYRYEHRLDAPRVRSWELGQLLGVDPLAVTKPDGGVKILQPGYLASLVMKGVLRFCFTADERPTKEHVPYVDGIDGLGPDGKRLWDNNHAVRAHVEPFLDDAWRDICNPDGRLPFKHDHYLKIYERDEPYIPADAILFDEAQDASPVMLSIVEQQQHAQLVFVGDANQQIYSWRGSIDALQSLGGERAFLTQSFRFGDAIADVANVVLDGLGAELRLRGLPSIPSVVRRLDNPRCVLTRTNAAAMQNVLYALATGVSVHLVGDGAEIERFARAVIELQTEGQTDYHELACFSSWGEVVAYVEDDPNGDELTLLVRLIDEYGPHVILDAMRRSSTEETAQLIVSTAHKSKGREWASVKIDDDFRECSPLELPEEWRLLYVAVTRAQLALDVSDCAPLLKMGVG